MPAQWPTESASRARTRVGIDAVRVQRLTEVIGTDPARRRAVFTERELGYCRGRRREAEHLAGRFAAKEAVLKAYGTGIARGMRLTDVELVSERGRRPRIELSGAAAEMAVGQGAHALDVSLTHTDGLAVATAVITWT